MGTVLNWGFSRRVLVEIETEDEMPVGRGGGRGTSKV